MKRLIFSEPWIILFGGANRQAIVSRLLEEGLNLRQLFVPQAQSDALKATVKCLLRMGVNIKNVPKNSFISDLLQLLPGNVLSVGFPYILPREVIEHHKICINVHPTLLPKYRGPSSGAYILINSEKESGSTVHLITPGVDDGPIIAQSRVELSDFETIRSLQRKVYASEPDLVVKALSFIEDGMPFREQDESVASIFPRKRTPEDSEIDPTKSVLELFNFVRACDPDDYPAFFYYKGEKVCIRFWRPNKPSDQFDLL